MRDRRVLTGITLTVLVALLVVGAVVGWRTLSAPLPETTAGDTGPSCDPGLKRGEVVSTKDITVTVLNAGSRAGLAGQTQQELIARDFIPGAVGNAPGRLGNVKEVRVLSESKDDPAARLVARQFGKKTRIQETGRDLGPGVEVVVGNKFLGLVKAPRKLRAKSSGSGC